jgi:hypothetical protein
MKLIVRLIERSFSANYADKKVKWFFRKRTRRSFNHRKHCLLAAMKKTVMGADYSERTPNLRLALPEL